MPKAIAIAIVKKSQWFQGDIKTIGHGVTITLASQHRIDCI